MIDYKRKKEGLEREKNSSYESRRLGIIQLKACIYRFYRWSMVAREEFHKQQVEEEKEETILEMLAL